METMAIGMFAVMVFIASGSCLYSKKPCWSVVCNIYCCSGFDLLGRIQLKANADQ